MPVAEATQLVIDQTLYWQVVTEEAEAWFRTGILNSTALTEAILPFNPKGDFGPRHIHTLPYRLIPPYDSANDDHQALVIATRKVSEEAAALAVEDAYIGDPNRSLPVRRRRMREYLLKSDAFLEVNRLSAGILGTGVATSEA
nr:hypothetical protein [Halomonas elongata]